jgi:hypothetical protein
VPVHSASPFPATGGEIPWTYSHFTDPYIALARASGVTKTIKLGTGITLVPERNSWPRRSPVLICLAVAASCSASAQAGCGRRRNSWGATSSTAGRRHAKPSRS